MPRSALSLIDHPRHVPTDFSGMTIPQAAAAWHRAGFDVFPARADGVRISAPHVKADCSEQDVLRLFRNNATVPGLRMGVNLPDDLAIIQAAPLEREDWRLAIRRLQSKYDPEGVLFHCPCHRIAGHAGAYLWVKIPVPIEEMHIWGPDGTSVFCGGAFVRVPPAGTPLSTKASWMRPPAGPRWEIPPCPPLLWEAIQARVAEGTADEDCRM